MPQYPSRLLKLQIKLCELISLNASFGGLYILAMGDNSTLSRQSIKKSSAVVVVVVDLLLFALS